MAVIWEKTLHGVRYEIRSAGQARRLYTNGVLHSQINLHKPVTGFVWDLLMLPVFFLPRAYAHRVLLLGVGGGSVIRMLNNLVCPHSITGIELHPMHIYIAKKIFNSVDDNVHLVQADAGQWLRAYRGPAFDMIIDDLFGREHRPERAVEADRGWVTLLRRHCSKQGVVVSNFINRGQFQASAFFDQGLAFKSIYQLRVDSDENVVGAFFRRTVSRNDFNRHIAAHKTLGPLSKRGRLKYKIRRLI